MDYSDLLLEHLISKTGWDSDKLSIAAQSDGSYLGFFEYSDEEIETYIGSGFTMMVSFSNIRIDEEENCLVFNFNFRHCSAPALDIVSRSNPGMSISLYAEVARAAENLYDRLKSNFDREIWVSL